MTESKEKKSPAPKRTESKPKAARPRAPKAPLLKASAVKPALKASAVKPSAAKTPAPKAKASQGQENGPRPTTPEREAARKSARVAKAPRADESRQLALVIAAAALEKKAVAVEILDVVGKVDYADFLVLMTGRSNRHVDSLAQSIDEACAKVRQHSISVEGLPAADWVLIDFGDVVVHVFQEETRGLYDIEGLWLDAKRLPVPGEVAEG